MGRVKAKIKQSTSAIEREWIDLSLGKKKARTQEDKKKLKQINDIKKKGRFLHIPHD